MQVTPKNKARVMQKNKGNTSVPENKSTDSKLKDMLEEVQKKEDKQK
ncbi:hypothetical protein GO601_17255 [Aeromonas dhakensis]|nr:hypothetical protein GO601_17255 [Aeromonas dhakensis]